jgi:hypothetical protein
MNFFDPTSNDIILISYPSGGFGNFLYHVLTEHANQTVKIKNNNFEFSLTGNSHSTNKYNNVYQNNCDSYSSILLLDVDITNKKILVLCDDGINNDSYDQHRQFFPNATIVRIIINPLVRPIVYQTCVVKAMQSTTLHETQSHVKKNWIELDEDFAVRENFTLLYHNWPFKWYKNDNCVNLDLEFLITNPFKSILWLLEQLKMQIINEHSLKQTLKKWLEKNSQYFQIYHDREKINSALDHNQHIDLTHITSLHDQGYINYWVEQKYNITIPVYDYKSWFKNTRELQTVIKKLK